MGGRAASPESYKTISDSESSEYASPPPVKKARTAITKSVKRSSIKVQSKIGNRADLTDIEDLGSGISRPHRPEYHSVDEVAKLRGDLLSWFEGVRDKRGMPWRKRYDHNLSATEKGQRAYEIWVSEVMLQQTQVATVIDYWKRWMEKWPTIADLAKADIEEVNSAWKGLGYYRRARSLLKGSQTVMGDAKFNGRLPKDPAVLEKQVDGVGRYTAGAITSMAYGVRTPIVDGNVHRLLTRLLAVHAPQADGSTIKFLWQAAEDLIETLPDENGVAGDWNQALMELGSQVCKPIGPDCKSCPLQTGCKAFAETKTALPVSAEQCKLCAPIPGSGDRIPNVTVFPMKKEKKVSREENEVVCILEWCHEQDRKWLFTKRPEKGLLAGLFEPPTTPVDVESTSQTRFDAAVATISRLLDLDQSQLSAMIVSKGDHGSIPHIFSHINMTYHIIRIVITSPLLPDSKHGFWLDMEGVEKANIGTGVKKVWKEVYGSWGSFEVGTKSEIKKNGANKKSARETKPTISADGKIVKKIMMPMMPRKVAS